MRDENKSALQTCVECIKQNYHYRSRFKTCNLSLEPCIQDAKPVGDSKWKSPQSKH